MTEITPNFFPEPSEPSDISHGFLADLIRSEHLILAAFEQRVKNHRGTSSTQTLINSLINKIDPHADREVNAACLDDEGLTILFYIQNYEIAHIKIRVDYTYDDLRNIAKELNI